MKNISLIITICLLCSTVCLSQEKQKVIEERRSMMEQKADSAIANRMVKRMKELFAVTANQELELYKTGININGNRRKVFKEYWKTEAFPAQMAKVDSTAGALYTAIVGAENYKLYKDVVNADVIRKQAIIQQRAGSKPKDTLTPKTTQP